MPGAKIISAVLAIALCAAAPSARLLEGYFQVTNLTYTQDDDGKPRGFNNTGLYIAATDKRIRVVGAWRGIPIAHNMIVDRTIRDTLVLKDTDSPGSTYKFRVRNNEVSGRHSMTFSDGTRHIIDAKATLRRLNQGEIDRLRVILNF